MHLLCSLASAERSADFEVVVDLAGFGSGSVGESISRSGSALNLEVDVLEVVHGKGLTILNGKKSLSLSSDLVESVGGLLIALDSVLVVEILKELVVLAVHIELHGVLVVGEQSVVSVGEFSQVTSL